MKSLLLLFACFIFLCSCSESEVNKNQKIMESDFWLIPREEVLYDFDNRDQIKSIDNPQFEIAENVDYIFDHEPVFALKENGIVKIYPKKILAKHEIVNDSIVDNYFAVTYCPLTKSAVCFSRMIDGEVSEFGVSGMLYNDNLMPYDRNSESIWSQMLGMCVNGEYAGRKLTPILLITLNWKTIKEIYPDALVLLNNEYLKNNKLPDDGNNNEDNTDGYSPGDAFMGVIDKQEVILYNYQTLKQQFSFNLESKKVVGSSELNFISSFMLQNEKSYRILSDELPYILSDESGDKWDIFGYNLTGEKRLASYYSYTASLWAWELFFHVTEVYGF